MSSSSTDAREVRKFGLIAVAFFGAIAALALWRGKTAVLGVFSVLFLAGVLFALAPGPMAPAYRAWMRVSHRIGQVTTAILLTLTFYLAVTPVALMRRLFGGSPAAVEAGFRIRYLLGGPGRAGTAPGTVCQALLVRRLRRLYRGIDPQITQITRTCADGAKTAGLK